MKLRIKARIKDTPSRYRGFWLFLTEFRAWWELYGAVARIYWCGPVVPADYCEMRAWDAKRAATIKDRGPFGHAICSNFTVLLHQVPRLAGSIVARAVPSHGYCLPSSGLDSITKTGSVVINNSPSNS